MLKRFVRGNEPHRDLKLTPCPYCKSVGSVIHHGWLYGYGETAPDKKIVRARRLFCNNRKARNNGCGHTFTIWMSDKLKHSSLGTNSLLMFLKNVLILSNKAAALRKLSLAPASAYRLWMSLATSKQAGCGHFKLGRLKTPYDAHSGRHF